MFQQKLRQLEDKGRLRSLAAQPLGIDLTSNDYLGFARHPELQRAAAEFYDQGGAVGAGASRLLRGEMDAHMALEAYAAEFFGAPRCLFFSSGFQANYALFTSLPVRGDVIVYDALIHASTRDGIRASDAKSLKFAHNDLGELETALKKANEIRREAVWVAVESVYSMDGDAADLEAMHALCNQYDAYLIIDEAHGVGVCGTSGKGLSENLILSLRGEASDSTRQSMDCLAGARSDAWPENIIVIHTCGKALGVAGGLVCASEEVVDFLINAARPFIFSTAPMPVQAHLVQKSLELLASSEGKAQREKLTKVCTLAKGLLGGAGSHIVPIILGEDERAVKVANAMQTRGYDVRAIRPPTVPAGTARLRISLNAELSKTDLQGFADALGSVVKG